MQEVRRGGGGSINTSESIYPGAQIRERGGGGGGGGEGGGSPSGFPRV